MAISNRALDAALALAANPLLAANMRRQELPPGIDALLRALSGDAAALAALAGMARLSERKILDALENYVQQVMLFNGASPHRILGVPRMASRDDMRAHMRLLMIWLHPDRSGAEWRGAFSARVLIAWRAAQSGEPSPDPARAPSAGGRRSRRRAGPAAAGQTWRPIPVSRRRSWLSRRSVGLGVVLLSFLVATVAWALSAYSHIGLTQRFLP